MCLACFHARKMKPCAPDHFLFTDLGSPIIFFDDLYGEDTYFRFGPEVGLSVDPLPWFGIHQVWSSRIWKRVLGDTHDQVSPRSSVID
jgi:hypothetical protein